jgi:hypothetical protein
VRQATTTRTASVATARLDPLYIDFIGLTLRAPPGEAGDPRTVPLQWALGTEAHES